MKPPSDKAHSTLLTTGFMLAIGGFLGSGLMVLLAILPLGKSIQTMFMGIAGLLIVCFVVGLGMLVVTLASGLRAGRGGSKKVVRYDNVKIIARFGMNAASEMLFDEAYMDADDPHLKLYVRLQAPGMSSHEYRCNGFVWGQCCESTVGTAMVQGDWIGQFMPTSGPGKPQTYQGGVAPP